MNAAGSSARITERELKITAALLAAQPGIVEHVRLTGRLPEGLPTRRRLLNHGTELVLTADEECVYRAVRQEPDVLGKRNRQSIAAATGDVVEDLDFDTLIEYALECIREDGTLAFYSSWLVDSMAGSGAARVYRWFEHYWREFDDHGLIGPFGTLQEALENGPGDTFAMICQFTNEVYCSELSSDELVELLPVWRAGPDEAGPEVTRLTINTEPFTLSRDGTLTRMQLRLVTDPEPSTGAQP